MARLKKNRVAATKGRDKRWQTADLQESERELATERNALNSMADALREEVIGLENVVFVGVLNDTSRTKDAFSICSHRLPRSCFHASQSTSL